MSDDTQEGYVHRPDDDSKSSSDEPVGDFGSKGWILVAALTLSVLVIPGIIYLYPAAPAEAGFSFFAAMLVLPMIPAVLLGLVAVWSMTAATNDAE